MAKKKTIELTAQDIADALEEKKAELEYQAKYDKFATRLRNLIKAMAKENLRISTLPDHPCGMSLTRINCFKD